MLKLNMYKLENLKKKMIMEENIYDKICVNCGKKYISKGKAPAGICPNCLKEKEN